MYSRRRTAGEDGERIPVAVALGSNRGDRLGHLRRACRHLAEILQNLRRSRVYESEPWGYEAQPPFLNMCCVGSTRLPPAGLLRRLQQLEAEAGRDRDAGPRWGPRPLDLDLLLYGDRVVEEPHLRVPHPRMTERAFVLVPLSELAPDWRHPVSGLTVEELSRKVDRSGLRLGGEGADGELG